jgi:DNA adenine methylase
MISVNLRTPITYWGGKQLMATKLLPMIPQHSLYCEPFTGGAALFWAKLPSDVEVLNDLNGEVSNFYEQIRDNYAELCHHIQNSLHSRLDYQNALHVYQRPAMFAPVKRAWAFWVLTNQGWGGKIGTWGYGVGDNKKEAVLHRKRESFLVDLHERLKVVQIECNDALKGIKSRDRAESFFYIDPPYFNSCMGHYDGYTEGDFDALLTLLGSIKGKFLLSSYPSPTLEKHTKAYGWHTQTFEMNLCAGSTKGKKKREVVTSNYLI